MNAGLSTRGPSKAAKSLLTLRRNLASAEFLQNHIYTRDESKFVGSTYVYWIRLHCDHDMELEVFPSELSGHLTAELNEQLRHKVFERVPDAFSDLVRLPSQVDPEDSVSECLTRREQQIKQGLPACIPYATCFGEINRLVRQLDVECDLRANAEEFDALFEHLSRNALKQARARFPEVWDEVKGHYVLDSRGSVFAKAFAIELRQRGYLTSGSRFVDLGSGTGTMIAAVSRFTDAHATGVERHAGVMSLAKAMIRRLRHKGCWADDRIELIVGDLLHGETLDWSQYDVLYTYSPIGKCEIGIDDVIDRMHPGAILAMSNRPQRSCDLVEELEGVAGLSCFRRLANG